ncbi:predicted protein [Histoplasma capsulatum G186AR]|uniref:Uncharacterized protein n=1 Tax=Ajellomyces capsulatus (strain G186AR / H82 / ATCC MYA-2454 / RMSCC 2432) TaxID=447093 RepID=C0P1E4_AJECG|nr:uncharacterized protein HCBG_09224 [Histoplasma capsulatum G186AR]EEH02536.1 predicted protein [Histoplasma capsulatum G186AR]
MACPVKTVTKMTWCMEPPSNPCPSSSLFTHDVGKVRDFIENQHRKKKDATTTRFTITCSTLDTISWHPLTWVILGEICVNDSLKRSSTDAGVESIPPAVSLNSRAATTVASLSEHSKWGRQLRGTHALIVSPMVSG